MSEWDSYAAEWDDDPAARSYAAAAFASLEAALNAAELALDGSAVLDFGCGTGLLTERLVAAGASVTAVDTSSAMLDVLRAKIGAHGWTSVDVSTELPTTSGHYQLVVCSSVCSFLGDYPGTVGTLAGLMAPGAMFVQWDWERDESVDESHGLSRTEIRGALTGAGLNVVSVDVGFEAAFEDQVMSPLMGIGQTPA